DLGEHDTVGNELDDNRMSAADLATLSARLMSDFPEVVQIIEQTELDIDGETYDNSNSMLPGSEVDFIDEDLSYEGVNGLKAGYTEEAGYGVTGSVEMGEEHFISFVTGADSYENRFKQTEKLYDALEVLIEKNED